MRGQLSTVNSSGILSSPAYWLFDFSLRPLITVSVGFVVHPNMGIQKMYNFEFLNSVTTIIRADSASACLRSNLVQLPTGALELTLRNRRKDFHFFNQI